MSMPPSSPVGRWLVNINAALARGDSIAVARLFEPDGDWRDILAFTWTLKTLEGRAAIAAMLEACLADAQPVSLHLSGEPRVVDGVVEAFLDVETARGRGRGHVRLARGRARTLLTTLEDIAGHEERRGPTRPLGTTHGEARRKTNWAEARDEEHAALGHTRQPDVVIIGGGQGGIALGARLKQLHVPTVIVEALPRPGDTWRARYKSLVLHDPVWYDHLPYLPFPDHWPVFTPKDQLADWLEAYVSVMGLNYWGGTRAEKAEYHEASGTWRLDVTQAGRSLTLHPKHLVLATGSYGKPRRLQIEGADKFGGTILHSADYRSGEDFAGKRCVVVGSNSSAHDVAADLHEHGCDVTMLQRSPTTVIRSETLMEHAFKGLYSEEALAAGITTDKADLIFASVPFRRMAEAQRQVYARIRAADAAFYAALERAGFLVDWGPDETGLMMKALRTGSGYYIDVGCSGLIIAGKVKVRAPRQIARLSPGTVHLDDGSSLAADAIITATGYGSMTTRLADLVSAEVAETVGPNWGYGSGFPGDPGPWLGELRNMWKPLPQKNLWYHGGNLHLSRFYSKFLALQLKARVEGLPTRVYG